ncbi:MAG: serine protease [Polyangiaceae bacterium]|nr:serine protease [Polyangiaceae bacterium]
MKNHDRSRYLMEILRRHSPHWLEQNKAITKPEMQQLEESTGLSLPTEAMIDLSARLTPETPAAELSPDDVDTLEAIVHTELRPALLVQDGTFLPPPQEWIQLTTYRGGIDYAIARTCRIEMEGSIDLDWAGTGFVVADDLIATNRHVLEEFASFEEATGRWRFYDGVTVHADFRQEIGSTAVQDVEITGIWGVHNRFDLAILQAKPSGGCPSPLIGGIPDLSPQSDVVVIGYPAYDSRRNDAAVMDRIFRGIYNVKRVLPGQLLLRDRANYVLRHDCSTLGGNSGSPVIDLRSGRLIGIHFRGQYLQWNEAIDIA